MSQGRMGTNTANRGGERPALYVGEALAVAEELADEGISIEVVDPRTLVPLDAEDAETFRALRAPVRRVCAVPVPYSPTLEGAALPSRDDIKAAVYEVLKDSLRPL